MSARLNMRKHGLLVAVGSLAAQGIREGVGNSTQLEAYVLEALQSLTLLEVRDLITAYCEAQNAAKNLPAAEQGDAFTRAIIAKSVA